MCNVNVQLNLSAGVRSYLVLARLPTIDYSFDAESEIAGENILGRFSITETMQEYTRMTQRNAEIFKRDTEFLEC